MLNEHDQRQGENGSIQWLNLVLNVKLVRHQSQQWNKSFLFSICKVLTTTESAKYSEKLATRRLIGTLGDKR